MGHAFVPIMKISGHQNLGGLVNACVLPDSSVDELCNVENGLNTRPWVWHYAMLSSWEPRFVLRWL